MIHAFAAFALPAQAAQTDIAGPGGSNAFGSTVTVLANGNIVVTDPDFALNALGAVYLYSPAGVPISTLSGSTKNDHVGSGGIVALTNGNFVVVSPLWANGTTANAGAATLVDGSTGLTDSVSPANSLVGSKSGDQVGSSGVIALTNGHYAVVSPNWSNGSTASVGAVTWGNGASGVAGAVGISNSLIGSKPNDHVGNGGVAALANGNYVVVSPNWDSATTSDVGAVTWRSGASASAGTIDAGNSLVGSKANDHVGNGGVTALTNGNYVVASGNWTNDTHANAGAATWGNGASGVAGVVASTNSLVGTTTGDQVGSGGITVLTNGNYVVSSRLWSGGVGAVTWGNGSSGTSGAVSGGNSLTGSVVTDQVGETGVTALVNGNYVVISRLWDNLGNANAGAVTWGNGGGGTIGAVSSANSLVGGSAGDRVGGGGVVALSNGNYVASSPLWDSVIAVDVGAVTWGNGTTGSHGTVTSANSLTGALTSDQVGSNGIAALSDGNYVTCSSLWDNGGDADVGAATWSNGGATTSDVVSAANSLTGSTAGDLVCSGGVLAVGGGGFVVASPSWNGAVVAAGAVTWGSVGTAAGVSVSADNSLTGSSNADQVGSGGVTKLANGDYLVRSPLWDSVAQVDAGAISVGRHSGGSVGPVVDVNSAAGTVAGAGATLVFAYDIGRDTLIVGEPAANIISVFKPDRLFASGFQ